MSHRKSDLGIPCREKSAKVVLISIITIAAGVQAFFTVPHDEAQTPFMIDHRNWALATAIIWWIAAVWEGWRARRMVRGRYWLAAVLVVAMVPLLVTGWKGAELVYRHRVGVMTVRTEATVTTGTNSACK